MSKVISWAEYQVRKITEKAKASSAEQAPLPDAFKAVIDGARDKVSLDKAMATLDDIGKSIGNSTKKGLDDLYVRSAGKSKPKKEPKYYDFDSGGTATKEYPNQRGNSYSGGYGGYGSYQSGKATPVAVYERCYSKHKPLRIVVKDKEYFIYGGSCSDPVVKDADIYVGFERGMRESTQTYPWSSGSSFMFPIVDGNVPTSFDDTKMLLKYLADSLAEGKKVHIGCIGGHGRTGTILAALVTYMTGNLNSIEYVRTNYCEKAVETTTQINWLNKHWGIEKVTPSKGHYTTGASLGSIGKTTGVSKTFAPRSAAKESGSLGYTLFDTVKPVKVKGSIWGF